MIWKSVENARSEWQMALEEEVFPSDHDFVRNVNLCEFWSHVHIVVLYDPKFEEQKVQEKTILSKI